MANPEKVKNQLSKIQVLAGIARDAFIALEQIVRDRESGFFSLKPFDETQLTELKTALRVDDAEVFNELLSEIQQNQNSKLMEKLRQIAL